MLYSRRIVTHWDLQFDENLPLWTKGISDNFTYIFLITVIIHTYDNCTIYIYHIIFLIFIYLHFHFQRSQYIHLQLQLQLHMKVWRRKSNWIQLHSLEFINKMRLFAITFIMLSYAPRICTAFGSRSIRPLARMKTSMTLQDHSPLTVAPLLSTLSNTLSHNRFLFNIL